MAVVYQAAQKSLQRKVAIKILPSSLSQQESFQQLFQQEARVLANLSHPNIVPIFSYGQFEKNPYFAMELLHGETLREKIEHHKPSFFQRKTFFPIPDVIRWVRQIALALEYAHQKGVIHRDIKPANIIIDENERVFVTDFGLVHVFQMATAQEMPCGTPCYMSHEQAQGKEVDERTDIYSLGCVMYELLTGSRVSNAQTATQALAAIEKDDPRPPSALLPAVPMLLDQIILKALQKNRDHRYQSMSEFLAVLDKFASGKLQALLDPDLRVRPKTIKEKKGSHSAKTWSLAVLLLLLGATIFVVGKEWRDQRNESIRIETDNWCNSEWQIAQNFQQNNMKELAAQTYRKIIERYPHHPIAQRAKEELKKIEEIS